MCTVFEGGQQKYVSYTCENIDILGWAVRYMALNRIKTTLGTGYHLDQTVKNYFQTLNFTI